MDAINDKVPSAGANIAQWIKLPLAILACHIGGLAKVPAALLPFQLPANNVPGKTAENSPSAWVHTSLKGVLDGVHASRL